MDAKTHKFEHLNTKCSAKYDPQCPACVVKSLSKEINRLQASLREAASRNGRLRKQNRRRRPAFGEEMV